MEMDSRRDGVENVAQEETIDQLEEVILTKIFPLLPPEDNVRTSFVCSRYFFLWSPLSNLDLDCKRFCKIFKKSSQEAQKEKFTNFVNTMFALYQHQHLKELRLALDLSVMGVTNPDINKWVYWAMQSDPAKLNLEFTMVSEIDSFKPYTLPRFSPVIRSVTVMRLNLCKFVPLYYSCFESLQTVIFRDVALLENAVNDLINRCPVLEELHLIYCVVSSQFDISTSAPKLNCLVLDCLTGSEGRVDSVRISVPSLLKFRYVGELLMDSDFHVSYLDNLIEAYIFLGEGCFSFEHEKSLHNLIGSLCNVNTLTLCSWSLELLGLGKVLSDPSESHGNLPFPLYNLKHLTLHSCLGDYELKGLHRLLRSSPSIETISVKLSPGEYYSTNFLESQAVPFDWIQYLKEIEIKDFRGLEGEIKFLKYIFANALALEKIIIYKAAFRSSYISKEQDKILFFAKQEKAFEVLLDFTRASPELKYYSHKGFCSWVRSSLTTESGDN